MTVTTRYTSDLLALIGLCKSVDGDCWKSCWQLTSTLPRAHKYWVLHLLCHSLTLSVCVSLFVLLLLLSCFFFFFSFQLLWVVKHLGFFLWYSIILYFQCFMITYHVYVYWVVNGKYIVSLSCEKESSRYLNLIANMIYNSTCCISSFQTSFVVDV